MLVAESATYLRGPLPVVLPLALKLRRALLAYRDPDSSSSAFVGARLSYLMLWSHGLIYLLLGSGCGHARAVTLQLLQGWRRSCR